MVIANLRAWRPLGMLPLLVAVSAQASVLKPSATLPEMPNGLHLVLGKVLDARAEGVGRTYNTGARVTKYTYSVQVLCAVPKGAKIGRSFLIVGYRTPPHTRSWPLHVPIMKIGVYFVTEPSGEVSPGSAGAPLSWGGNSSEAEPFGVFEPSPVAVADVPRLKAALLAYARLYQAGRVVSHTQALRLRRSKNYYLWALGTWAVAKVATPTEANLWAEQLGKYSSPGFPASHRMLSPRRAFWILHCLRSVVPTAARPSGKELLAATEGYLQRLAQPRVPGYRY